MTQIGIKFIRHSLRPFRSISALRAHRDPCNCKAASPPQFSRFPLAHFHSSGQRSQQSTANQELSDDQYWMQLGRRPSEKVVRLADEMFSLSVLEVSDVADLLKKKLKIGNMPMMGFGMMPMQAAGGGSAPQAEEKKPEKMTFDVKLEKYDAASKIKIIKEVRAFTSLGLKEAKELVEKIPATLKTGISKEEASDIVQKLKALGATVAME